MKVERRDATTMTTSFRPTSTTATIKPQIQTENKTNQNLLITSSGKININEKEKEKDAAKQNSTEHIKGNGNAEQEVQNMQEKEDNRKARTTKKCYIFRSNSNIILLLQHNKTSEQLGTVKIASFLLQSVRKAYFSGAKTDCMNDFIKPSLKNSPDLDVRKNDLFSNKTSGEICTSIIILASLMKWES